VLQRSFVRRVALILPLMTIVAASHASAQLSLPTAGNVPTTQTPPPAPAPDGPPPLWFVSAGAGLAVTGGNTDTSQINLTYEVKRDGGQDVVYRSAGLYLRGETDSELTVDRTLLDNRVDRRLTERLSAFGQFGYLRDRFKEIDYLMSPGAGLSYAFVKNSRFELFGDGGAGVIIEKNRGFDRETDGSVLAGERLAYTLSDSARITQAVNALWKMDDFDDALYTFTLGVSSALTTNSQVKVELLDQYKNKPENELLKKNDVSLIVSFVYKLTRD